MLAPSVDVFEHVKLVRNISAFFAVHKLKIYRMAVAVCHAQLMAFARQHLY